MNREQIVLNTDLEVSTHTRHLSVRLMKQERQTGGVIHRKVELSKYLVELMDVRQVVYASSEDVVAAKTCPSKKGARYMPINPHRFVSLSLGFTST
jgi:hypothetical protein